jgi:hypothetical protein
VGVLAQEKIEAGVEVSFTLKLSSWPSALSGKGTIKSALETQKDNMKGFRLGIDFTEIDKSALGSLLGCIAANLRKKKGSGLAG